jgi:ABC-type multidrug transport system fused ATPase/permease subunit
MPRIILGMVSALLAGLVALLIPQVLRVLVDGPLQTGDSAQVWPAFLVVLGLGILEAILIALRRWLRHKNPIDLRRHKINMGYSWVGRGMAGVSQIASNPRFGLAPPMGAATFWGVLIVLNLVIYAVGTAWIFGRLAKEPS